jgi:hypothetical protein
MYTKVPKETHQDFNKYHIIKKKTSLLNINKISLL